VGNQRSVWNKSRTITAEQECCAAHAKRAQQVVMQQQLQQQHTPHHSIFGECTNPLQQITHIEKAIKQTGGTLLTVPLSMFPVQDGAGQPVSVCWSTIASDTCWNDVKTAATAQVSPLTRVQVWFAEQPLLTK